MTKIIKENNALLLERKEILAEMVVDKATPSAKDVLDSLAKQRKVEASRIIVKRISPMRRRSA